MTVVFFQAVVLGRGWNRGGSGETTFAYSFACMADREKQQPKISKRQAEADIAAQRYGELCPKCGSHDVKVVEPFNPVHADGIYCGQCGRHSFPDES